MTTEPLAAVTVETLRPIAYRGEPVLTTELLAAAYGTEPVRLHKNHSRNVDRFVEGRHFFKIAGSDLRLFRKRTDYLKDSQFEVGMNAKSVLLWTARGAARHAKMLETDAAWEVFEALEDSYFDRRPETRVKADPHLFVGSGDYVEDRRVSGSARFCEEVARLGYESPKAFAATAGWTGSKLWSIEHGNTAPSKPEDLKLLIGRGFDLRYVLYGERTIARAELDLIAAYREGDTAGVQRILAARPARLTDQTNRET
ncbi:ORF6N domain-containing protein [Rhodospira trueperi]|uniref:ORF6N domain-containing protein n=1 Tax=Rhodospira trueperi TaxID=69960 RepID=A0A1G7D412_9PROT|nr:ORF6N domain-containing protein [Rhodospira trueperi]SDE46233.1 ORF6N domain-containing protein [Rhodospira trueperi]